MAALTVQTIDLGGLAFTTSAASASGDTFANDGNVLFYVKNSGASSVTVTFTGQNPSNFGVTSDKQVVVGAGAAMLIGPFLKDWFNDANGNVSVSYSDATSVSVAALKVLDAVSAL